MSARRGVRFQAKTATSPSRDWSWLGSAPANEILKMPPSSRPRPSISAPDLTTSLKKRLFTKWRTGPIALHLTERSDPTVCSPFEDLGKYGIQVAYGSPA
ncbi:hypothetical protein PG987_004699 [Apiospora arundinis]